MSDEPRGNSALQTSGASSADAFMRGSGRVSRDAFTHPRRLPLGPLVGLLVASFLVFAPVEASASVDTHRTVPTTLESEGSTFLIDAPRRMSRFVAQAADVIDAQWPQVAWTTGAPPDETYFVHIESDMRDWFHRNDLEPRSPEWAAGLAIGSRRTLLLATGNPDWEQVLVHELAHLAVAVASGDGRVPRWINEGWAIESASQFGMERAAVLFRAGLLGNYLDFETLEERFPRAGNSVSLAYAQSASTFRFLQRRHGDDFLKHVLRRMRDEGDSFHRAFLETTGESLGEAVDAWETSATARFRWAPAATGGGLVWGGMALLAVFVIRRRRARNRTRLKTMEQEESRIFDNDPDDETFGGGRT